MIKLFELRNEKQLSQRGMAKIFNISQGTYNNWENGKTQPSIEQLLTISAYFQVSLDYLLGNSDDYGIIKVEEKLSQDQILLLKNYAKLSNESKQNLILFLQSVAEK